MRVLLSPLAIYKKRILLYSVDSFLQSLSLTSSAMASSLFFRILSLYNLLNAILLALVPKKLRSFLPTSWYQQKQQQTRSLQQLPRNLGREDYDNVRRVFQMFDHNRDGTITKEELRDSLESIGIFLTAIDFNRMFAEIDSDGDDCIDISEFTNLYRSIVQERNEEEEEEEEEEEVEDDKDELVREAFDVFDQNRDGFITVDELWSVMDSLGMKQCRAADDCRRMIGKVDVDGDGRVDFVEFKRMLKGGGFAALN